MINFKSIIAREVLGYFLLNPHEEMYLNEMARKFKVNRGNLTRKLAEWQKEGILIKDSKGNMSLYKINSSYPLLTEITSIFNKSIGLEKLLKEILQKIKGIKMAIIFGSYAKNQLSAESDIDLLLVGSHSALAVQEKISKLELSLGREINTIDMTEREYQQKQEDDFLKNILNNKYIELI